MYFKLPDIPNSIYSDPNNLNRLLEIFGATLVPIFTISEIGVTHRWITHWEKYGLLDLEREDTGWRRFTFLEFVWLRMIVELRQFNLPLAVIKAIKENLFKPAFCSREELDEIKLALADNKIPLPEWAPRQLISDNIEELLTTQSYLLRLVWTAIFTRRPVCLLFSLDGDFQVVDVRDTSATMEGVYTILDLIEKRNFVCINLQLILQEFYRNPKLKPQLVETFSVLTDQEKEILNIIRKGNFKEVIIKEAGKEKGYTMTVTKAYPVAMIESRVIGLMSKDELEEIRIVSRDGNPVLFEKSTRMKI